MKIRRQSLNRMRQLFSRARITEIIKFMFSAPEAFVSYAQCGEDILMHRALTSLGVTVPCYLDIGAHHPIHLSNTYFFYCRGSTGVLVEPDPTLFQEIRKWRPRDLCMNIGVTSEDKEGVAPFYLMSNASLNTFSRQEAERIQAMGHFRIKEVRPLPVVPIRQVITRHFPHEAPHILSIDIEGLDYDVLTTIEFSRFRPKVVCLETVAYKASKARHRREEMHSVMRDAEYFAYGTTQVNTIFVDRTAWEGRSA